MGSSAEEGMLLFEHVWSVIMKCVLREPIACGSVIRLQHLQTRLFLHSHNFRSPLSNNQEVSCFGDGEQGDEGMINVKWSLCPSSTEHCMCIVQCCR